MYAKSYYNAKYENKSCFFNSFQKKKKRKELELGLKIGLTTT